MCSMPSCDKRPARPALAASSTPSRRPSAYGSNGCHGPYRARRTGRARRSPRAGLETSRPCPPPRPGSRVDRARRIVQRHDQVQRRQPFDPVMPRAVLVQHHARQRTPRTLLAMRPALRRPPHQPRRLQRQRGHRVAQHLAVPLSQLLVEVLRREVRILVAIEPSIRSTSSCGARFGETPEPAVGQPVLALR